MKKSTLWKRVGDYVVGKGFYIVLSLCVATIGISGYYLVSEFNRGQGTPPSQSVGGEAQVVVPWAEAVKPTIPERTEPPVIEKPKETKLPPVEKTEEPEPQPAVVVMPPVYTWPVKGDIISAFSLEVLAYDETMGDWRTHSGVDIAAQSGTRVLAMSSGTVRRVYEDDLMGSSVVIDHGEGLVSYYHNLTESPTVHEGDEVATGTVIGAVGDTAIAESGRPSHLHLEVSLDSRPVDPVAYLPQY